MKQSEQTPQSATPAPRTLNFVQATGVGVSAIVGGGIFVLGGVALAEAGAGALLAFTLNGILALLTAAVFAELATTFPENGGQYLYARRSFSVRVAFLVGWVMMFAHIVAAVLYALGFAAYAVEALRDWVPASGAPLFALGATGFYSWRLARSGWSRGTWPSPMPSHEPAAKA